MSLLIHSLVVVMLLAAVTAENCADIDVGTQTGAPVTLTPLPYGNPSGNIYIPHQVCQGQGYNNDPHGWHNHVCSNSSYPTPLLIAPTSGLEPVTYSCTGGCPDGVTVYSTIYC